MMTDPFGIYKCFVLW